MDGCRNRMTASSEIQEVKFKGVDEWNGMVWSGLALCSALAGDIVQSLQGLPSHGEHQCHCQYWPHRSGLVSGCTVTLDANYYSSWDPPGVARRVACADSKSFADRRQSTIL